MQPAHTGLFPEGPSLPGSQPLIVLHSSYLISKGRQADWQHREWSLLETTVKSQEFTANQSSVGELSIRLDGGYRLTAAIVGPKLEHRRHCTDSTVPLARGTCL